MFGDRLRRRRKDTRFILAMLGLLLLLLGGLYALLLTSRDLPTTLVTNRLLLFVLWYINVVLVLVVLFVLARNLFKLLMERRGRVLGSKFKGKLVASYIGLSLIPVLLLFLYGTGLLQQSVDRWFAAPVRQVLQQGSAVAESMLEMAEEITLRDAVLVAEELSDLDLDRPQLRPRLNRQLQRALQRLDLDYLGVYRETDFVQGVLDPQAGLSDLPEPGRTVLMEAVLDGQAVRVLTPAPGAGRLILGAAAVPGSSSPRGVVVAGRLLSPTVAEQSEKLILAYQGYRQLESQKGELSASQVLLFLMVTLLILLASSWVGLYLARRVTVPIQALADGTRRISSGDLAYRVEVEADDELGVLVDSFNRMTAELERNKDLLEEGNRELVDANRRLAEERALIVAVLHNVAAGVVALDGAGRVVVCNGAALAMLRQGEEELRGRTVADAWGDPERRKLLALLDTVPPDASGAGREIRLALGGEWKTFEVKVTSMRDASGKPFGRVLVLEDLTELIKAQQLAAWNEAARRIAHEIKNPLTPIQLAAERMLHKYRQGQDVGAALEDGVAIIVREVETLKAMVEEFSRYARMPRPQPVAIDLPALLGETIKLYRDLKEGVAVRSRVEPGAESAWVDPEQLRSALINLLDNAVDATEAPGEVSLSASRADGRLQIRVADTGHGIPAEARGKLFLPHFSTKGRGTGLGLAIVHRIVSDHHGTIRVEDNAPRGTVFTIDLPQG
ncbi:MAG TPA: ATP-binding protein [Thermoanaerobaculia bacterium]|nr:ATP-binding protein [Thermoanaerobaculia bacterium]